MIGELAMVISWHAYAGRVTARAWWRVFRIGTRAARLLAGSRRLPLWLRAVLILGCIQIPFSPVDEICLIVGLACLALFYRPVLLAAWGQATADYDTPRAGPRWWVRAGRRIVARFV